ncbi:unnamed protein product [Paramecium primaurelia]|uniref:EGF-like domain-containing protein n=1 Tax=Paramecium primaurelia TaxID=5886 RepID=A0A8S1K037_PARPR|nr:unnamed protein product [Paramecium primaurelia]
MNQLVSVFISVAITITKANKIVEVSLINRNQQEQEENSQINKCQLNQIKIDEICQNCHFSCEKCFGLGQNKCISCNSVSKRILQNNQCICMTSYYEKEQQSACQECHKSCQSCQGSTANDCLSCFDDVELLNGNCICKLGQFYDYNNMECRQCHFSCEICYDSENNNCLKCHLDSKRSLIDNNCKCVDGYYEIEGDPICKQCHINCKTCSEYEKCLSCSNEKLLVNNECVCKPNFYLYKSNFIYTCKSCSKQCLTCFGQLEYECLSCVGSITLQSNNTCSCNIGYYLINNQCQICNSNCRTCAQNSTYCLSCQVNYLLQTNNICCHYSNIFINNLCSCISSKYMDSNGICQQCASACLTCSSTSCNECSNKLNYGSTCSLSATLPQYCNFFDINGSCASCLTNFVLNSSKVCECNLPYFVLSGSVCLSCSTFRSNCTDCNNSGCTTCNFQYYLSSGYCVQCHQSCKTCQNNDSNSCYQCQSNNTIQNMNGSIFGCLCIQKYYFDSNYYCQMCDYTCESCLSSSTQCTSCNSTYNRILSNSSCICNTGYQDFGTPQCYKPGCGYGCADCVAGTCNSCMGSETFRKNEPSTKCPCIDGYYDIQQRICQQCPSYCSTCQLQTYPNILVCTKCQINRDLNNNCRCAKGFYESEHNCILCPSNCSSCIDQDRCIQCKNNNFDHDKINGQCLCNLINFSDKQNCQCLNGYYLNNINKKCLPCHYNCNTCIYSATNCITCNDYHAYPPNCECSSGFYLQDSQCLPCTNNCFLCKSQFECLDCSNQMQLINNKCYCQNGYFNLPNSYECLPCSNQCSTCRYSINNCTSCKFNRILPQKCICPDGTYEIDINTPCNNCDNKCKLCEISSNNCLQCSINRINPPNCNCIIGYFENDQQTCQQCNKRCKSCQNTSETCIECKMNIATPPNCTCPDGYYYESEQGCIQCHSRCKTCIGSNEYNCLSCDESKNFELLYNKCVCQKNYYFQNDACIYCTIEIEQCQTIQCGNGIIQKNEQCDDWNNVDRDGCSNTCKFEEGYFCESISNTKIHNSILMTKCIKCIEGCKTCYKNKCLTCQSGYFMTPSFDCLKCDFHCKECSGPQQKDCLSCIKGVDYGLGQKCAFCEETQGLYTSKDKCVSKCGDGMKKTDEQCDDGNIINKDGCSEKCKIEEDWDCSKQINTISSCYKLNIPIASISFNRAKDFYQSQRQGSIKFNKLMAIPNTSIINAWQFNILNQTVSYYNINMTAILNIDGYLEEVQIDLQLLQSMSSIIFQVDFTTFIIKDVVDSFQLKTTNLSIELTKYIKIGQDTLSTSKASKQFAASVLYILASVSIIGLLIGSLEFYWNVLDNLQILSYITYINVNFPYMHNKFLEIFEFARFEFTNDYFNNFYIVQDLDYQQNKDYPLIVERQVEYNLVVNLSSIAVLWITPIILFIVAKINLFIIHEILINKFKIIQLSPFEKLNSLTYLLYKFIYFVHFISFKYYSSFFYSILLRIYLSSLYDLNFSIFTSFYCWLWNKNPNLVDQISFVVAMLLLLIQFVILFILSSSLKVSNYQLKSKKFKSQFSSLYEGVNFTNQIIRQIQFLQPLKKLIFMGALLLFYDQAVYQISLLISIQILSSLVQISFNPYLNFLQSIKGITQELGLSLSLTLILIYYAQDKFNIVDQNVIEKLSYIHVGIYTLMLCISLVIDLYQQFKIILVKYKISKICKRKIKQEQQENQENQEKQDQVQQFNLFIDLSQFYQSKKNQYSFKNLRIN